MVLPLLLGVAFASLSSRPAAAEESCAKASGLKGPLGLDGVDFDRWTALLWDATNASSAWSSIPKVPDVENYAGARFLTDLLEAAAPTEDVCALAARIEDTSLPALCGTADGCRALVGGLLMARQRLRAANLKEMPRSEIDGRLRDRLLLLDTLAAEAAVVMTSKFPKSQSFISERFDSKRISYCPGRQAKLPPFLAGTVCHGDVVISQRTGRLAILSRLDDAVPSMFVQAAVAYVPASGDGKLQVIRSLFRDGLKVRSFDDYFSPKENWHIRIYRLHADSEKDRPQMAKLLKGIDQFVRSMAESAGGDPEKNSAAPYDFEQNMADSSRVSAAKAVYLAYHTAGFSGWLNPYPEELWRSDLLKKDYGPFLVDGLGMDPQGHPGIGIIDFNPHFDLVADALNARGLANARVVSMVIDSLAAKIRESDPRIVRYIEKARRLPRGEASRLRLSLLAARIGAPNKSTRVFRSLSRASTSLPTERFAVAYSILGQDFMSRGSKSVVTGTLRRLRALWGQQQRLAGLNTIRKIADEEVAKGLDGLESQLKRL